MLIFLFARICVILYLMYLRYAYLPQLGTLTPGSTAYNTVKTTADILIIFWEFIYLLGCCLLFTQISYCSYVWKRMSEVVSTSDFPIFLIVNGFLYFTVFLCLVVQFVNSYTSLTFIYISFYLFGFYAIGISIFLLFEVNKVNLLIKEEPKIRALIILKEKLNRVQYCGWSAAMFLMFRGFAIIVDTLVYPFIPTNTSGQIIWNIIFKYIFWIVPEFLIVIFISLAYIETDIFITEVAIISIEFSRGRRNRINELNKIKELEEIESKKEGFPKDKEKIVIEKKQQMYLLLIWVKLKK